MTGHTSRILPLFIAAIMALMSGACRSHKNAAVPPAGSLSGEAEAPVSHSTAPVAEPAAMALAASYSDWTDVQMPVRMELTAPKNFAISGRASMVRGKAIYISMRMLGLEVASVYIDTDTVVVMEKLNKTAYVESLPKFTAAFGLTVGDIQDLLLGRAFAPGTGTLAQGNMSLFKTDAALFSSDGITAITPALSGKSALELIFAVDESMSRFPMAWVTDAVAQVADKATIVVSYARPFASPAGTVSSEAALATKLRGRDVNASMQWSVDEARWNTGVQLSPRSTRGYRIVDTATLLNILKGLAGGK